MKVQVSPSDPIKMEESHIVHGKECLDATMISHKILTCVIA
jgi:hypothetical protein